MEQFKELSQETMGEDFIYFLKALEKLEYLTQERIEGFRTYTDVVTTLKHIYPQRFKAIDEEQLYEELKIQKIEMVQYKIDTPLGAFTYLTTKFMLGSQVLRDPLYAWVRKYMKKDFSSDREKSRALFAKGQSRVRREIREIRKMREEV